MADRVVDYAIFLLDVDGNVMSWNAGAAAIKQYRENEIVGKHFSIFYTPADKARDWPKHELRRAMTEGRFEDEGWRVRKDGSRFWANVIITALRDERGTLRAFSKITRDLTVRKNYEEIMRQSEERFRLLVEGVQDYAIYMVDPSGVISSWNLGAHRIKGYAAAEIIGRHFSRFYTPEDIEAGKPWSELAIAREQGRAEDEGWRVRKDGSRFWARVVVTPLYNAESELRGFAKVTQNLTQRRQAEALELSANNVNDFIAVLAHELRNPLAPIRNAIQLQRMTGATEPAHRTAIDIIERQSGQLARIVDDLLDVSRISRGTLSIHKQPVSAASIVERAIETARPNIEAARHKLEALVPPGPLDVNGDELRLTQALTNIINNAARYTDPGGNIYIKVSVANADGRRQICISVRDTGRGIERSLLHSIFGMFVQGKESLNRPSAGLGVGLALARSIVELHDGTLEARSGGTGQGAEFIIRLPALSASAVAQEKTSTGRTEVKSADAAAVVNSRVLLVDDNVDAATALASLLKNHGQEVLAVSTGREALQAFEGFRPEIVLLDIGMPGMDGLEIARRLRARNRSPRPLIVAVTGWNKPEDLLKSKEAGFDMHFVKPLEEPQLLEILRARQTAKVESPAT
ncbi:MAG: two-component hybrid sensor and regulator [Betaproteobacteria bacterium]|nr:two-component hybrid sensor and regulator [Betaproteobacteria bacterium]